MQNKKLIISLFSLCLVAIVGLLATVIVFAATSQNIESKISITYTANQVSGSLTAKYTIGTTDTPIGTKSFTATTSATGTWTDATPTLTASNKVVKFTYTFTNNGDNDVTLALTGSATDTNANITIEYSNDDSTWTEKITSASRTVEGKGESGSVYVRMTIKDTAKNVGLSGSYSVNISNKG